MTRDYGEELEKKYTDKYLDLKAKVEIQSNNYNFHLNQASLN